MRLSPPSPQLSAAAERRLAAPLNSLSKGNHLIHGFSDHALKGWLQPKLGLHLAVGGLQDFGAKGRASLVLRWRRDTALFVIPQSASIRERVLSERAAFGHGKLWQEIRQVLVADPRRQGGFVVAPLQAVLGALDSDFRHRQAGYVGAGILVWHGRNGAWARCLN